jgi:acyl-CoA reductase-like NAD-dependent aldehyde dehydrogenase
MALKYISDINPATGKVIKKIKCSSSKEIQAAVNKARKAFVSWSNTSLKERIGKLITDEMGKLYKSAVGETHAVAYGIRETISQAKEALKVEKYKEENLVTELHRTPLGVCSVITPWNFPVSMLKHFYPLLYLRAILLYLNHPNMFH